MYQSLNVAAPRLSIGLCFDRCCKRLENRAYGGLVFHSFSDAPILLGRYDEGPPPAVTALLDPDECDALVARARAVAGKRRFPVDHTGRGATVLPALVRVSATTPAWMTFAGGWGEDSYLRVPGGEPAAYSATGPKGPAFHEQWRAPVAEVLSWPKG